MFAQVGALDTALLGASALLAAFFAWLYGIKRQRYVLLWAAGWSLLAIGHAIQLVAAWSGVAPWQAGLEAWLVTAAALAFFASAQAYAGVPIWSRSLPAAALLASGWAVAFSLGATSMSPKLGAGIVVLFVALQFLREGHKQESRTELLLAAAFAVWGLLVIAVRFESYGRAFSAAVLHPWLLVTQMLTGALMVTALYEEEKRRVERNMLALTNLNLATSSFVGGEIQRMLVQALDRMLSVARIPSGVIFLHYGDPQGPRSMVLSGLSDEFGAESQREHLDEYLVKLIARLGGLVVLRDLARDSAWAALEREPQFRRSRELFLQQGLHTIAGISLQARERVFGVLLLGTPDQRRFTPAELRLLLALGHQIGMAVENSYLIQQTSRRSEELHILNEIGRGLSSTLDPEDLFEKIFTEMRRLLDVSSFYIAFFDEPENQIRYELEFVDNARQPKRVRPFGNHLTEYMLRTRQPVLIREHFAEAAEKLGVTPLRQTGCFCGVPLVFYDRAIGVMAVHSLQERLFDEGHLELLRVLASEAGIAIENARLFAEEQKKSRQLALVNSLSRHAISTLNADEMLARIAEEMQNGLTYDHIGIAMLNYTTKALVVRAEAGRRLQALGCNIPLGEGLIGQVARIGKAITLREIGPRDPRPLLDGTVSATARPITFSDHLLGVLYVESSVPCDFKAEDELLLNTLADLLAGALHNAVAYQRAKEQAITDGLTGVKTHRYLMEALTAEWKRSTRANRSFSLVLMDLDRFKFVNDFFGHLEGDVVLQRVGHLLEQHCRRSDVVARYGGDEFVILMPETAADQAELLAQKLREAIMGDALLRDKNISASFGIAAFPVHGSSPQELIQVADASMYLSKHQGGNAVSTAERCDVSETKRWKRDVLEAYLGVTLKRNFATGPEAFQEILARLEHFTRSLNQQDGPADEEKIPDAVIETLTSLAVAIDGKSHYTQGHSQKVSAYAVRVARALNLSENEIEELRLAGLLHDVGKVGISEAILIKAGPLDPSEWETMKTHTAMGARLLEPLGHLGRIQAIILHHHEFFDGSGYPAGLAGSAIPLGARIIGIADAFDTITSDRVYKKARPASDALAELERCSGTQFDPELVKLFIAAARQYPNPVIELNELDSELAPGPVHS